MTAPRRVLFITYYFPPSGGPGVQRALKFVRYLPEFGWEPVVLTVDEQYAAYPDVDRRLIEEIPVGLQVVRTRAWDPYAVYARLQGKAKQDTVGVGFVGESESNWKHRLGRWARANLFLPDARVGWVPYAIREGSRLLREQRFDAIVSTGPPHSLHLVARKLARRSHLPWLADFRDPWTGIDYYSMLPMSWPARRFDTTLERSVLRSATAVSVVSPSMRNGLRSIHDRPYAVVTNGYDPADFVEDPPALDPGFVISYVGNLNQARNPEALWDALQKLKSTGRIPGLRLKLVGNIDPTALESARSRGVDDLIDVAPYVPHHEAIRTMRSSTLLLLVINRVRGAEGILTGKVYEYIASGRPVLGIGPVAGDAAAVLNDSEAGHMFDFDDSAGVARFLQEHYQAWEAGKPVQGATSEVAERYSRRGQTRQLAALLTGLAAGAAKP